MEVLEGVLTDAGDFVGIQQSAKTIQNSHVEHRTITQLIVYKSFCQTAAL